jgi:nucleotide-binding universal stress UspA family protein
MNIVVGVDGTGKSLTAVRFVGRLLDPSSDRVGIYFAPPRRTWTSFLQFEAEPNKTPLEAFTDQTVGQAIDALPRGISAEPINITGASSPSAGIQQAADAQDADLVVVGAGRSSQRLQFFVGGVARDILHRCPRSVLACRENARLEGPLRVLVAIDPDEATEGISQLINQLAWPAGTTARVLHVMDYVEDERLRNWLIETESEVVGDWAEAYEAQQGGERVRAMELLVAFQQRLMPTLQTREPVIEIGHVVETIVARVQSENIDLVIVGGRCRGRFSRLLGSTTEGLLLQSPASLLVVHARDEEA